MNRTLAVVLLLSTLSGKVWGGEKTLINNSASSGSGQIEVRANAIKKVTLVIRDTGSNNLVSDSGIDFGEVDASANVSSTGIAGSVVDANTAEYRAPFVFAVNRTGSGKVSLTVHRSVAGNFNATDGVVIEDSAGAIQPLSGVGSAVTVVDNQDEGNFNKELGIRVRGSDAGAMSSTLTFTASAL